MPIWIALLRGINVGGATRLPMKDLIAQVEQDSGAHPVRSYLQSGNLVLRCETQAAALAGQISAAAQALLGFAPPVMVLSPEALQRAIADNPFGNASHAPATLQLGFLAAPPAAQAWSRLESLRQASEGFALKDQVFYLHAPEGVGRSRLAAGAEKALGVPMTLRNWKTVTQLLALATALQA